MAIIEKGPPNDKTGDELTKEEYEFLFELIKSSTFRGTQLETIYNIIIKLQNKYLKLINK